MSKLIDEWVLTSFLRDLSSRVRFIATTAILILIGMGWIGWRYIPLMRRLRKCEMQIKQAKQIVASSAHLFAKRSAIRRDREALLMALGVFKKFASSYDATAFLLDHLTKHAFTCKSIEELRTTQKNRHTFLLNIAGDSERLRALLDDIKQTNLELNELACITSNNENVIKLACSFLSVPPIKKNASFSGSFSKAHKQAYAQRQQRKAHLALHGIIIHEGKFAALVSDGGTMHVAGVGDTIGGYVVCNITATSVIYQDKSGKPMLLGMGEGAKL